MNEQINWQAEREEEIEALYHSAAVRFAAQPEFAAFLLTLAAQEREHGKLLQQLRFIAENNIPTLKKPANLKVLQEAMTSLLS